MGSSGARHEKRILRQRDPRDDERSIGLSRDITHGGHRQRAHRVDRVGERDDEVAPIRIGLGNEGRDDRIVHRREAAPGEAIERERTIRRPEGQQHSHVVADADELKRSAGRTSEAIRCT